MVITVEIHDQPTGDAVRRFDKQAGFVADRVVFVTNTGVGWAVVAGICQDYGEFVACFQGRNFLAAGVSQRQGGFFVQPVCRALVHALISAIDAEVVIRLLDFFEIFAIQLPFLPLAIVAAAAVVIVGVHVAVARDVVIPASK